MSYTPPPAEPMDAQQERTWSTLTHVIAGGLNVVTAGMFTGLIASIVTYVLFKDRGPLVRVHTATTLNFQITMIIAELIGIITSFIVVGVIIIAIVWVLNIILSIRGAVAASRGEPYRYPLTITFVK